VILEARTAGRQIEGLEGQEREEVGGHIRGWRLEGTIWSGGW
jgi:hypothetical protein